MSDQQNADTSTSLLRRLRQEPANEVAWRTFVDRYGGLLRGWCRKWGLQEADADDVTQNVMLELSRQMRAFEYDPQQSFRGWLRTITHRSWARFIEARKKHAHSRPAPELESLLTPTARDDFLSHLEAESQRELVERAKEVVSLRVQPRTWQAFLLMTDHHLPAAEVGRRLGMKEATVYVARSKVQRMLRDEVSRLEEA